MPRKTGSSPNSFLAGPWLALAKCDIVTMFAARAIHRCRDSAQRRKLISKLRGQQQTDPPYRVAGERKPTSGHQLLGDVGSISRGYPASRRAGDHAFEELLRSRSGGPGQSKNASLFPFILRKPPTQGLQIVHKNHRRPGTRKVLQDGSSLASLTLLKAHP